MAYKPTPERKARDREYYLANKERINSRNREYYKRNAQKLREYSKKYREVVGKDEINRRARISSKKSYSKHREKKLAYGRKIWRELKRETFNVLGGAICIKCGFKDTRALQIDHINGGGMKHIKSFSSNKTYLKYVRENPTQFQVLCANCNWIKIEEKRELYVRTEAGQS